MEEIFSTSVYYGVVWTMIGLAVIVFLTLHFVTAGYGMMYDRRWGPTVGNRSGWILMEAPAWLAMLLLWIFSERGSEVAPAVMGGLFMLHYTQRTFVFPFLLKGKGKMPLSIILMGVTFNTINAYMIGGWLFHVAPVGLYTSEWLATPQFIIGTVIFFVGMGINIHSDHVIRSLRRPGDTRHYIPRRGMYHYVASGNYFGEFVEWCGYAVLTWSLGGLAFAIWTFANLAPRARSIHKRYIGEFGEEYARLGRKYLIPFIY